MENGAIDYLSFVRGFIAARENDGHGTAEIPAHDVVQDAYAEGYAAGATLDYPVTYRELSVQDGGRFTGTLDLGELPVLSGTLDLN
ncbi:hypothetical protein ABZ863_26030 [Saccharomonospora sp. NPDC046836]|uniref:hypothetical protein n=1 Tax=Saccharomonospora sp. NPDC046836 TaxID=3156921 RepID=UPI0033FBC7F8